ncbi:heavy-metal-associated domain-containing protein [Sediminimonas sp.]|uniref:heavy-metal-associated domain-containing protein n=1 Tax=Sediminimonas sp. TaxID=2823379 RepID=UPI0025FB6CCA|nr:heavy-metal-associated domain-containing protein [Sediminimonas sp.]
MTRFAVPEMSCGHCTAAIEAALKAADPEARVDCDLGTRHVSIESRLDPDALKAAIAGAGYDATAA